MPHAVCNAGGFTLGLLVCLSALAAGGGAIVGVIMLLVLVTPDYIATPVVVSFASLASLLVLAVLCVCSWEILGQMLRNKCERFWNG